MPIANGNVIMRRNFLEQRSKETRPVHLIHGISDDSVALTIDYDDENDLREKLEAATHEPMTLMPLILMSKKSQHGIVEFAVLTEAHEKVVADCKVGFINIELADIDVVRAHVVYSVETPEDEEDGEEKKRDEYDIEITTTRYRKYARLTNNDLTVFFSGDVVRATDVCLDCALLKSAPKRYLELKSDCLEYAKNCVVNLLEICDATPDSVQETKDRLQHLTITTSPLEAKMRRNIALRQFGLSYLQRANPLVQVLLSVPLILLVCVLYDVLLRPYLRVFLPNHA